MMNKTIFVLRVIAVVVAQLAAPTLIGQTVNSPDRRLSLKVGPAACTVYYRGQAVGCFGSHGIQTRNLGEVRPDASYRLGKVATVNENYTMLSGKRRRCSNAGREAVFASSRQTGMQIRFRVYNNGIAFRYELSGLRNDSIIDDLTEYGVPGGAVRFMGRHGQAYEEYFPMETEMQEEGDFGYPALIQTASEDVYMLLAEAGMERNQSASYLHARRLSESVGGAGVYGVRMAQNPLVLNGKWHTPWRTMLIGTLSDIVSSTLVTDLAAPSRIADTSWIVPGVVSWPYWAYNHGSKDYQIVCQYIDMAHRLRLPYVLIDAEWDEMGNGGNIYDALDYAGQKGVKVMIWYNSSTGWLEGSPGPHYRLNDPERREKEFRWLNEHGIAGVKIDFFDGDNQQTMAYCIDLLESAARHRLLVNFHGATVPRGWQRTYPHLLSTEGVLGAEWYNNNAMLTTRAARHNTTLPFIRNVVGSMDYTPCAFSDSQHPHITTDAHELALTVLFESALQHLADKPESFYAQPEEVREFISSLPTTWDDTRLLCGYPGDYVVLARRKGSTWYVAGINGSDHARTVRPDLGALAGSARQIAVFEDCAEGHGWNLSTCKASQLPDSLTLRPRGGFVYVLKR